ncbi:MAG: UxaA family hydrolase [Firmicutes bacterium]|nr:UxaA family hydrolase [Bacillota bacterium]
MTEFYGYRRPDGRVGIRNYVLILPTSVCASDVANIIANQVDGAVSLHNQVGCSQVVSDQEMTLDFEAGFAANPNVYATVLVSLGCEGCQLDLVEERIKQRTNKPVVGVSIQEARGTLKAVEIGVRYAKQFAAEASMLQKEKFPITELLLATECGGSDPTSGIAANNVIGALSDRLVDEGATTILSETPEFIGGEHLLAARAVTPEVGQRVLDIVHRYEETFWRAGEDIRSGNPTPGNKAGGITTLEEKSLGCIHKGGTRPVQQVYDYAKQIPTSQKGLVIMDTPGNDPSSMVGMAAGGAQVCVFSTGRGSALGNPIMPVIKITGNADTWDKMEDNIDFDASRYITGTHTIEQLRDELYNMVIETCNGKQTKSEALGINEIAVMRTCNYA